MKDDILKFFLGGILSDEEITKATASAVARTNKPIIKTKLPEYAFRPIIRNKTGTV